MIAACRVMPAGPARYVWRGVVFAWMAAMPLVAQAQEVAVADAVVASASEAPSYRMQVARHLYELYGERVFKGQLPPLLYAIAIVDVEVDEDGSVIDAVVTREPASAKDVIPWIVGLIKAASPFPKPQGPGRTRFEDVWLVDRTYMFQLHTLTEGQR
jgi:protein TonB